MLCVIFMTVVFIHIVFPPYVSCCMLQDECMMSMSNVLHVECDACVNGIQRAGRA